MDDALLRALRARRNVSPEMSLPPPIEQSVDPNAGMSTGVSGAFNRVRDIAGKATDYAPIAGIIKSIQKQALEDQMAGADISMLGGKHLAGYGKQLTESALERSKPFRPNAADTAYVDPSTGQIVEAPHMGQQRTLKVAEFELQRRMEEEKARLAREQGAADKEAQRQLLGTIAGNRNTTNITIADIGANARKAAAETAAGAKGVGIPAPIAAKIGEVKAEMSSIDKAIALAEKNPDAFGVQKGLPGAVAGDLGETYTARHMSPDQRKARYAVYEEVSGVIKNRAGTAQSKGEKETLMKFLPTPYDDVPTIKDKFTQYKSKLAEIEAGHHEAARLTGKKEPVAPAGEDHSAGVAAEVARRNAQRKGMSHGS